MVKPTKKTMSFKHHINSHFSGCVCLAQTRDECRDRTVHVYALPGEFDLVGVSDGTDAWVAPVVADPFSVNVKRLLEDHAKGVLHNRPRKRPPDTLMGEQPSSSVPAGRVRHVLPASF